jgi:hypothetical protein
MHYTVTKQHFNKEIINQDIPKNTGITYQNIPRKTKKYQTVPDIFLV